MNVAHVLVQHEKRMQRIERAMHEEGIVLEDFEEVCDEALLKKTLNRVVEERSKLETQVIDLQSEVVAERERFSIACREIEKAHAERDAWKLDCEVARQSIAARDRDIEELNGTCRVLTTMRDGLFEERKALHAEIAEMRQQHSARIAERDKVAENHVAYVQRVEADGGETARKLVATETALKQQNDLNAFQAGLVRRFAMAVDDYNALLRSAHSIAVRRGQAVEWDGYANSLLQCLTVNHATWLEAFHVMQNVKRCECVIEMATFRDRGSECMHCKGVIP